MAAVRTMPTRATASDRCSGSVQGSVLRRRRSGPRRRCGRRAFSTPTALSGVDQRSAQCGIHCRPELDVAGLPGQDPGGDRQQRVARGPSRRRVSRSTSWSSSIGSGVPVGCVVGQHGLDVVDWRPGQPWRRPGAFARRRGRSRVSARSSSTACGPRTVTRCRAAASIGCRTSSGTGGGLVPVSAAGHLGDRGGGRAAPGPQVGRHPVGGEQVAVVDQVDDDLRGSAPDAGALLADDGAVVVE